MIALVCALCATAMGTSRAQMDLPAGLDMTSLMALGEVIAQCEGNFGDIVSLYMVDAAPLIAEITSSVEGAGDNHTALATNMVALLESDAYESFANSETLQKISDELDLSCLMKDEQFLALFNSILESQGVNEEHEMYETINSVPDMVAGFYDCGGRLANLLDFASSAVPALLAEGGVDVSSVMVSPGFVELTSSGFDMGCFFGVPEVSSLIAVAMG